MVTASGQRAGAFCPWSHQPVADPCPLNLAVAPPPRQRGPSLPCRSLSPEDPRQGREVNGKRGMAAPVLGPPPARSGLPKCQLRVSLPPRPLAEAPGEKLEPKDVFILNSVGPHCAKNPLLSSSGIFPGKRSHKHKNLSQPPALSWTRAWRAPPPGLLLSTPGGVGEAGCTERCPSCPQEKSRQLSAERRGQPINTGFEPPSYYSRQRALSG